MLSVPSYGWNSIICHTQSSNQLENLDIHRFMCTCKTELSHICSSYSHHMVHGCLWYWCREPLSLSLHLSQHLNHTEFIRQRSAPKTTAFVLGNLSVPKSGRFLRSLAELSKLSRTWVFILSHQVPFLTSDAQNIPLGEEPILNRVFRQIKWAEPNRQVACPLLTFSSSL